MPINDESRGNDHCTSLDAVECEVTSIVTECERAVELRSALETREFWAKSTESEACPMLSMELSFTCLKMTYCAASSITEASVFAKFSYSMFGDAEVLNIVFDLPAKFMESTVKSARDCTQNYYCCSTEEHRGSSFAFIISSIFFMHDWYEIALSKHIKSLQASILRQTRVWRTNFPHTTPQLLIHINEF